MNLCPTCKEDFATVSAFDEHRVGFHAFTYSEGLRMEPPREDGRRCMSMAEMQNLGWSKDDADRWRYPNDWDLQGWRWELDPDEVEIGEAA